MNFYKPAKNKQYTQVLKTKCKIILTKFNALRLAENKIKLIFEAEFKKRKAMFDFGQYLGFLAFLTILTIGFWLMFFLVGFVGYWAGGATLELIKEKRANKKNNKDNK